MEENTYCWLKNVLKNEYRFVKNMKQSPDAVINIMENLQSGKRILVKDITGNAGVYKELIALNHKNIPVVYDVVSDGKSTLVIEEYIDGLTVGEILETGLYTSQGVSRVIVALCEALSVLHSRGIVHRDIKPENVMITNVGEVKLIDYDISRMMGNARKKDTIILGTSGFASPEQYGISETDGRSDIYSMGILINVMLTGEHTAKKLCGGKWKKIVNKCTKINPDERFQNVGELIKAMGYKTNFPSN